MNGLVRQTKTKAKGEYHLSERQLLPRQAGVKVDYGLADGLPVVRFGTYMVEGAVATMFLRGDVERLATAVHGDWKRHVDDRRVRSAGRKKVVIASKADVVDLT